MKKMNKLIIVIICIIMIGLIIFFCKDFIIRQYFIAKIENVDYDEYILTTSYNGKKSDINYYFDDVRMFREYNENEKLENIITVYDYKKGMTYEYDIVNNTTSKDKNNFTRTININNSDLLLLLKNAYENRKFLYKGVENINNRYCYVLFFEKDTDKYTTIYLDMELFYTVREEIYDNNALEDKHKIFDYDLDLTLKQKDLFEFNLEE